MCDGPEAAHERTAIQHMMHCLDGLIRGFGLDETVAIAMLMRVDRERLIETRMGRWSAISSSDPFSAGSSTGSRMITDDAVVYGAMM